MKTGLASLLVALALVAVSCAPKPEQKLVGTYTGKLELPAEVKAQLGPAAEQMAAITPELTLTADQKFSLVISAQGQTVTMEGDWVYDHEQIVLTPRKNTGPAGLAPANPNEPMRLSVDESFTTLTGGGPGGGGLTFTKSASG